MIIQGTRTSIAKKPLIFVIFQGGGGGPDPLPPLDLRMYLSIISPFESSIHFLYSI